MGGKLVKEYGDFYLISDKEIESGDEYVKLYNRPRTLLLGTTVASAKVPKLSIKNCEAIANGYDLDELLDGLLINRGEHFSRVRNPLYGEERQLAKDLVQKTLELIGDKKFSEEDMIKAIDMSRQGIVVTRISEWETEKEFDYNETQIIQSLQQTEWDVSVVTELAYTVNENSETEMMPEPHIKLDKDGCLILKRI